MAKVLEPLCQHWECVSYVIGSQIDPGVPWTQTQLGGREPLSLALKSGNFGEVDFLSRAFEVLDHITREEIA